MSEAIKRVLTFLLIGSAFALPAVAAERYIIPIYGENVVGATGTYDSDITMMNLGPVDATATVTKIIPAIAIDRPGYPNVSWRVAFHGTRGLAFSVRSRIIAGERELVLGAVVVESDQPLVVDSNIYRSDLVPGQRFAFSQSVQVARDWVAGGTRSVLSQAIPATSGAPVKLYLINPNDFDIRFTYSTFNGDHGDATVAALTTGVIELPVDFGLHGIGSGHGIGPIGGLDIEVRSDFPYLAASSTVFLPAYPPIVRVAQPLR